MTRRLLDTTALIDFSKGREPASSLILGMIDAGDELGVCSVSVAEFSTGLPPAQRDRWDEFFAALHYWEISRAGARQAGIWRYEFAQKGTPLMTTDLLVAAVAHENHATMVTDNVKDYPMDEITVMPLRP